MVSKKAPHRDPLVIRTADGLYCPKARAHIDPWRPVECALITHAHADHARPGSVQYHGAAPGHRLLKTRLATDQVVGHAYGERFQRGDVTISFHPAGHVLGSAQIRLDDGESVWVISGDYKRQPDPTCAPFEEVPCDVFITEATFALPIYRWPTMDQVMDQMFRWWDACILGQRTPVLVCYSLGKAQRIMAEIGQRSDRSVWVHPAVVSLNKAYADAGIELCPWRPMSEAPRGVSHDLVILPPQAVEANRMKQFAPTENAMASGWMQIRGVRRRTRIHQGFVISDHADWPGLIETIVQSGAQEIYATHGETRVLTRYLKDALHISANRLDTAFGLSEGMDH